MSDPSAHGQDTSSRLSRLWLILLSRPVIGTALVLLAVLVGLGWRALIFIQEDLAPLIAKELSYSLNRPVLVGDLEHYSLTGLEFGPSSVPVHRWQEQGRTLMDRDQAQVKAVQVQFDLWKTLWTRRLNLNVTLVEPKIYLDQTQDGEWIATQFKQDDSEPGPINIALDRLAIDKGEVTLDPANSEPRTLSQVIGQLGLKDDNQRFRFNGKGSLDSGGKAQIAGEWFQPNESLTLEGQTDQLQMAPLMAFLPKGLPINLRSGSLDGTFKLRYRPQDPWQLSADIQTKAIDLRLPEQKIGVKAQQFVGKFDLAYTPDQLPKIGGDAHFKGATISMPEDLIFQNGRSRQQQLRQVQGNFKFFKQKQRLAFDTRGTLGTGGRLRTKGESSFDLKTVKVLLLAQNLPAPLLDGAFKMPLQVRSGEVDANLTIALNPKQDPSLRGTARLKGIDAQIVGIPQPFNDTNGYVRFRGLRVSLEGITSRYGQVPLEAKGTLDMEKGYNLVARIPELDVNRALASMDAPDLPIPLTGRISLPEVRVTGPIDQPLIQGRVRMAQGATLDRVAFDVVQAEFEVENPQIRVTRFQVLPTSGGQITGTAVYDLTPGSELVADLEVAGVSGDAIAKLYDQSLAFTIGPIEAQTRVRGTPENLRTSIAFATPQASYPTRGNLRIDQNILHLDNIIARVAGGTAHVHGQVSPERLQARVNLARIGLAEFSPELKGHLNGAVNLSGPLADLSPRTLKAQGQVTLSKGISLLEQPLEARFRWTGDQIVLQQATADGLWASGLIDAQVEGPQSPRITALNLQVRANDYDLRQLAALGPTHIPLKGRADLQARVTGNLEALKVAAALQFKGLAVSSLAFDPIMAGTLNYNPAGVDLRLAGQQDLRQDRINLSLDEALKPKSFLVQRNDALAQGQRQGSQLQVQVERFPLQAFNLKPDIEPDLGPIFGLASGQFVADVDRPSLVGEVVVDRPGIDAIQADRFTGQIRYLNGVASLNQGLLLKGESQYQLNAQVIPGQDSQFSGKLAIAKGQVADLVAVAQVLELVEPDSEPSLAPTSTAADLATVSAGLPQEPLQTQIQRLAELDQIKAQSANDEPDEGLLAIFDQLQGEFGGQLSFAGSTQRGVDADFDLWGQSIGLEENRIDQLVARGSLRQGTLNFAPLRVVAGESLLAFAGQLGADQQTGQLQLRNIPLQPVNGFLDLPVEVTGNLNGDLAIAGNFQDPQLAGQLTVVDGQLNEAILTNTTASLRYNQARLAIDGTAQVNGSSPVTLKGDLPFAPPFVDAVPVSDELNLTAKAQDDGLALLNLVTDQVAWQGGKGNLEVNINGTLDEPQFNGRINLQGATLKTATLDQPLTDLTGTIQLKRNLAVIPQLTANVDQGQLIAQGNLPLFATTPPADPLLTVQLSDLNLQVQELYKGGVDGSLTIAGSLLEPEIRGAIQLSNGRVQIANAASSPAPPPKGEQASPETASSQAASAPNSPITFKDLSVQVGDKVVISQAPVLSIVALGDLTLNGSVDQPLPAGIIRFRRGSINLITNRFSIDPRRENYAEFDPRYGLDPYLNLGMRTTVTEVLQATKTDLNDFAQLPASAIGSVQSVRIQATVDGRASELINDFAQVVSFESRPSRTPTQIIALLGGGVDQSIRAGQAQQAVVNLASSAAFNSIQGAIDEALGSRATFRAFPVLLPNKNNSDSSVLAFGAELGYDVTDRFSVSILQILTGVDEPTLFNFNYEITDQIRARTSFSSEGEAVGVVEYRIRF